MTAGYRLFLGLPFNLWAIVYLYLTSDNLPYEKIGDEVHPLDIPFDIPESWEWIRFKDLVDYSMGKTPPRKETEYWSNGTFPWVSIADLVADGTVTATKECVNSFAAENTFKGKISKAGTLLMSFKLTVGKVSILGIDAFHNEAIISIYPFVDTDKITTMFLFATLPLLSQSGDTKSAIKGNTLNSDSLDALLIPLPPIREQKRISDKLHELTSPLLDYAVAEQKVTDLNAKFPEALKKSILQEAVQGKLVPQDPSDEPAEDLLERIRAEKQRLIKEGKIKKDKHESVIFRRDNSHYEKLDGVERCIDDELTFEIPESWAWVRLGTVLEIARGGSPRPIQQYLTTESNGVNWIKIGDADKGGKYIYKTKEKICPEGVTKSRMVHSGDFLLTNSMSFGRPYILKTDGCIHDGWLVLSNRFECYSVDFLYYILSSPFAYYQFCDSVSGAVVKNLNSDKVANALFPLPPLSEQCRIIQRIEKLLPLVKRL